jgi:hypothetical protein
MRFVSLVVGLWLVVSSMPAGAQQSLDRPLHEAQPYFRDSGVLKNLTSAPRSLHLERVAVDHSAWVRVYFGDTQLGPGSFLRIKSELDGEVQDLDAAALALWSRSSAYFNGDAVTIEVMAGPGTSNRLVIERVASEPAEPTGGAGQCGICGPDDRLPAQPIENWSARLLPAGCTASIYDGQSCAVSAGHCISGPGMVLQFNVPLSSANCNINQPPIADQFPVDQFLFTNGGTGNDWSVMSTGPNNLGQKAFDRYGVLKPIATAVPQVGQPLQIWGYGVDQTCAFSQIQQTSTGSVTSVSPTLINHDVDATFGNSGSGITRNGTEILAIATHCPCPNWATRVDHSGFAAARNQLCPEAPAVPANLSGFTIVQGTPAGGGLSEITSSDNSYAKVQSVLAGPRHNVLTEITLQSPFNTVSELNLTVEIGPANATPVFHGVSILNFDTGMYESESFGVTSTSSDTTESFPGIANPNAYVNASGEIKIRVLQTARSAQVPGGFLTEIDQVAASVRP